MSMVTIKINDLIGRALDWAVDAAVTGEPLEVHQRKSGSGELMFFHKGVPFPRGPAPYSTSWAHGGPLIDKYGVAVIPEAHDGNEGTEMSERFYADVYYNGGDQYTTENCDTALIAVCRAAVVTVYGDEVQVPAELVEVSP